MTRLNDGVAMAEASLADEFWTHEAGAAVTDQPYDLTLVVAPDDRAETDGIHLMERRLGWGFPW